MMYEELVKELRLACDDERYGGKGLYLSLINRAAEAIEKLQAYADLYRDGGETAMRVAEEYKTAYIAEHDARMEETKRNCPHYIRNVHDRGDDSLCGKYKCEVNALPKWIPVTERLPEDNLAVLVTYIGYNSHEPQADLLAYRYDGKWLWVEDATSYAPLGTVECAVPITHWMPLPEPPKEKEK